MTDRVWHKGPPPHVGWWNARCIDIECSSACYWGWWDGKHWSTFAYERDDASVAASAAPQIGAIQGSTDHVEWSDYWPENARVPRIDPRTLTKENAHA